MIEGSEFRELLERAGLSRRQVAERLETSHTNLNNKCKDDAEVSTLYEYAVRWLLEQDEE
jgi:transcriptional regulator with XRE-family HTH domain